MDCERTQKSGLLLLLPKNPGPNGHQNPPLAFGFWRLGGCWLLCVSIATAAAAQLLLLLLLGG
jgi:hypothetical protein